MNSPSPSTIQSEKNSALSTSHSALNLAAIAATQIGIREVPVGSNSGPQVIMYQRATELDGTGWPWCAAFVCWCVQQWMQQFNTPHFALRTPNFSPPRTARAFDFPQWGRKNGCRVFPPRTIVPERGDIVSYNFSHCGIVAENKGQGYLQVIEGNTNVDGSRDGYEVDRKLRSVDSVMAFVRLPEISQLNSQETA